MKPLACSIGRRRRAVKRAGVPPPGARRAPGCSAADRWQPILYSVRAKIDNVTVTRNVLGDAMKSTPCVLVPLRWATPAIALVAATGLLVGCSPSSRVTPPVTTQPADTAPAWSPDGNWIAYAHFAPDHSDTSGLYVADTAGSQLRLIASGHPRSVDWSPDSRSIVYDDETGIHVVRRDGDSTRTIYAGGSFPSWSPDGSTIAFDTGRHIWLMSPTGADLRQASDAFPVRMPDWSEDGQRLVVVQYPQSAPSGELAVIQLADGMSHLITSNANVDQYPRWSPVGGMIVWSHWAQTSLGANRPEVWLADTSGIGPHRLVEADAQPAWHRGGRAVVFSKQASGALRLFVINIDGTGLRQLLTAAPPRACAP